MATTPISIDDLQVDDLQGKITQKVVVENISWQTYQAMLSEMGDHRVSRLTYAEKEQWVTTEWNEVEERFVRDLLPNPVGRLGHVEEVAHLVTFVASPLAGYINGANIRIDGGTVPTIN